MGKDFEHNHLFPFRRSWCQNENGRAAAKGFDETDCNDRWIRSSGNGPWAGSIAAANDLPGIRHLRGHFVPPGNA